MKVFLHIILVTILAHSAAACVLFDAASGLASATGSLLPMGQQDTNCVSGEECVRDTAKAEFTKKEPLQRNITTPAPNIYPSYQAETYRTVILGNGSRALVPVVQNNIGANTNYAPAPSQPIVTQQPITPQSFGQIQPSAQAVQPQYAPQAYYTFQPLAGTSYQHRLLYPDAYGW